MNINKRKRRNEEKGKWVCFTLVLAEVGVGALFLLLREKARTERDGRKGWRKGEVLEVPKKRCDVLWILPLELLEDAAGKTLKRREEEEAATAAAVAMEEKRDMLLCFLLSSPSFDIFQVSR